MFFVLFFVSVAVVHLGVRQNLDSQPDVSLPAMGAVLDSLYEWGNETSEVFQPFSFMPERGDRRDAKIDFDFLYIIFSRQHPLFPLDGAATWPPLGWITLITGEIIAICPLGEMRTVPCGDMADITSFLAGLLFV